MGKYRNKREITKQEKQTIKELGLTPQKASGATEMFKEDGVSDNLLMQMKSTEKKTTRISRQTFKDLIFNARKYSKIPFALIDFVGDFKWVMVRPMDLLKVAKELEKLKNSKEDKNER